MALWFNNKVRLVLKALVSLGLLGWLGYTIRWQEVGSALVGIDPVWLLAAVAAIMVSVVVSASKWSLVLQAQGYRLRWGFLWRTYWEGLFLNNFLPSSIGGDALRIFRVSKQLNDTAGALASVIVERTLAMAGIALTGLIGALVLQRWVPAITLLFGLLFLMSLVLTGIIVSGIHPAGLGRVGRFLKRLAGHGEQMKRHWPLLLGVLLWSVVFQVLVVAVNYCIFRALHINMINWWDTVYIIPVTSVIAMIPVSINGFGVREGAYVKLLQGFQVSATMAFSCSLIFAFLVSLCSLYGGLLMWRRGKGAPLDVTRGQGVANR